MKKLFTVVITITFAGIFSLNCNKDKGSRSASNSASQSPQNLTGEQISRLEVGKIVSFPAIIVKDSDSDCIYLFAHDDFKKYNGDAKSAIRSIFPANPDFSTGLSGTKNAGVTGKMTFIRDSQDTNKTCGTITGNLFEITEIE